MGSRIVLFLLLLVFTLVADASAQYFGQNKVSYRRHEFRVLETDHFDIYFHQERSEPVEVAGRLAERWWRRLSHFFGHELSGRQTIVLYSSKPDFDQTSIVSGLIDEGTAGLTELRRRRIALPFAGSLADTDHVLGHEIVHAFQMDLAAHTPLQPGTSGAEPLALWASEGLAEYLTLGPVDTHTAMWLRDAVRHGTLPRVADLAKPDYFPYRWGHAFWAYVAGRWDESTVARLFSAGSVLGMTAAVESVLGMTTDELTQEWHDSLRAAYPQPTAAPGVGTRIAGARPLGGSLNVGAAISPDGRWVAFLTERLFGVDLVVAEAEGGRIAATLTDTAVDPRYSSLQYVASAAAWDARSERLTISTLTSGRPALSIFRWPGGALEKDIVVDGVDEIFGPTWSPDGARVAFSAMSQGTTDLFVFDLARSSLRRLTDDLYADLQPAWSPDGRSLAFVTDRFTTDLETLTAGTYRLALVDVTTGDIQPIAGFADGKHIAPQWSRDGGTLYFISDGDGTPDVYSVDVTHGTLARVTEAESGIAGLTASSPALSVAPGASTAAVTVYEGGVFAIHTLALSGGTGSVPPSPEAPRLPPVDAGRPHRPAGWHQAAPAPAPDTWRVSPYKRGMQLEDVSQVTLSAGVDPFGVSAGGAIAMTFSDVLSTHAIVGAAQLANPLGVGISLRDLAGYGAYFNQARRWHWGVSAHVVPTYVGMRADPASLDALLVPFGVVRQIEQAARGALSYPFSRARRIEVSGGVSRLGFDALTGLFGDTAWTPAASPMTLGSAAAAFVSDTSHGGPLSVVSGERYRLEVAPVMGDLSYLHVTADYRKYVMPSPFYTLAARALHIGRYGTGADDARIAPLYLGYPWLVRGFDLGWHARECVTILSAACPELGHLLGSRLAVGNIELRFPLLRPLGMTRGMYGPVPVEVAAFVDGGAAWTASRSLLGAPNGAVWSAGVSLRTSLLGFGIGQVDIAHPSSPTRSGWVVQFNMAPAF